MKRDIEKQTIMDMKGLVFNDEQAEAAKTIADTYFGFYTEPLSKCNDKAFAERGSQAFLIGLLSKGGNPNGQER